MQDKRIIFFVLFVFAAGGLWLITPCNIHAQTDSLAPLQTVLKFSNSKSPDELNSFFCCRAMGLEMFKFEDLKNLKDNKVNYNQLYNKGTESLIEANIYYYRGKDTVNMKVYFFLVKNEKQWKIEDFGMRLIFPLWKLKVPTSYELGHSTEEEKRFIMKIHEVFRLFFSPDEDIVKYFSNNHENFESLLPWADSLKTMGSLLYPLYDSSNSPSPEWLPDLNIGNVYKEVYPLTQDKRWKYLNITFYEIGNYVGSAVGYLHVKDNAQLPGYKKFLTLQKLAPGWYFYRLLTEIEEVPFSIFEEDRGYD